MIDTTTTDKPTTGNMTGERIAMTIDSEYMGHVMNMLASLYTDQKLAVIREYSTNARDAMIEAGRGDQPIEVTLPSPLSPFLTIKDTGIGLDADGIRRIYSSYGASTKRDTNEQVGTFGIGCKSALAYADQFTLVGIKNGRKVQVAIGRDEDGGGMTIVSDEPCPDPSGVEILIPVKTGDAQEFESKAQRFFQYWEPGTVLVNGQEPKRIEGLKLDTQQYDMTVVNSGDPYGEGNIVVMGNVPYAASIDTGMASGYRLVVRVPIGAVSLPPARESLKSDPNTTDKTLAAITQDFKVAARNAVQAEIDKCKSKREAMQARAKWAGAFGASKGANYTFNGEAMPYSLDTDPAVSCGKHGRIVTNQDIREARDKAWRNNTDPPSHEQLMKSGKGTGDLIVDASCTKCKKAATKFRTTDFRNSDFKYSGQETPSVPLRALDAEAFNESRSWMYETYVIVEGYDRASFTATAKKKLIAYKGEKQADWTNALLIDKLTPAHKEALTWVNPVPVIKWTDVWAVKLAGKSGITRSGKPQGSYPVVTPPDASYVPPSYATRYGESGREYGLTWEDKDGSELADDALYCTSRDACGTLALRLDKPVVHVMQRRLEKWKREHPKTKAAHEQVQAVVDAYVSKLTKDQKTVLAFVDRYYGTGNELGGWNVLDKHGVKDPEVLNLIRLGKLDMTKVVQRLKELGQNPRAHGDSTGFTDPRKKYPLLDSSIDKSEAEHAALYINAVYKAGKGV